MPVISSYFNAPVGTVIGLPGKVKNRMFIGYAHNRTGFCTVAAFVFWNGNLLSKDINAPSEKNIVSRSRPVQLQVGWTEEDVQVITRRSRPIRKGETK
jgi:hypothetical protein